MRQTFYIQRAIRASGLVSLGPVLGITFLLFVSSVIPRVENPWPDTIGIGFPLGVASAWGMLAAAINFRSSSERRERAVLTSSVYGFCLGSAIYMLALLVQIIGASL